MKELGVNCSNRVFPPDLMITADPDLVENALIKLLEGEIVFDREQTRQHGRQFTWDRVVDRIVHPAAAA